MQLFSIDNKPTTVPHRKKTTVGLLWCDEPFEVHTQEGPMLISPETVDDWDHGYWVAYPDDGSKPYAISPGFVRDNYVVASDA